MKRRIFSGLLSLTLVKSATGRFRIDQAFRFYVQVCRRFTQYEKRRRQPVPFAEPHLVRADRPE